MLLPDWAVLNAAIDWLANGLGNLSWWQIVPVHAGDHPHHHRRRHHLPAPHPGPPGHGPARHPAHFFRFWLWLGTGMVTKEWVAIHRKHHAKCETPDDPHSPQTRGIDRCSGRRRAVPRRGEEPGDHLASSARHAQRLDRAQPVHPLQLAGRGPDADPRRGPVRRRRRCRLGGADGLDPGHAAGIINGIGHYWGYRNFEAPDASTNISPWGIVIGGEELHNNHHTYPTSAKFSVKPYEFDIGWVYISLMQKIGLATVKKVRPSCAWARSSRSPTRRRWRR